MILIKEKIIENLIRLSLKSLKCRREAVFMTVLSIMVSIFVLIGVEHIRKAAKEGFEKTVSGTDLIVGARTGSVNLLLYSVFRIGSPTNNIAWETYQNITSDKKIKWSIPISLGDSHMGYRVIGTNEDYFKYFKYGERKKLKFKNGTKFNEIFDVVLGFQVAKKLKYSVGDNIVIAHGISKKSLNLHDDRPFTVVGILEPTGTPVDESLHVSLSAIEAIHIDWNQGSKIPGIKISNEQIRNMKLEPKSITAFMIGLNTRMSTFEMQRKINEYSVEPVMAILPGVAISELWQTMNILENTLRLVSLLIVFSTLLGLCAMLLNSISQRRDEILLLRMIGASPTFLFLLIQIEAFIICFVSTILGLICLYLGMYLLEDYFVYQFGLHIDSNILSKSSVGIFVLIFIATILAAVLPSFNVYRYAKSNL